VPPTDALLAGLAAGLAVAVPLGAIGVLVIDLGLRHGPRTALAAGLGVATVDAMYALLAVTVGASVTATLTGAREQIRAVAAVVLAVVALVLLWRALGRGGRAAATASARDGRASPRPAPRGVYARFVALTAINPLTLATFAAVTAGLPAAGTSRLGPGPAGGFVAGVAIASATWHVILAGGSGAAARRLPASARRWTSLAGATLTLALALRLAL
jgi:threonine/homoserine/homoserine lactone efflux protein